MAPDEFSGEVALVTGGGRGIGATIAHELDGAGMRVAVAARTRAQVEQVAQEIGGVALELDVSDAASVTRVVGDVERDLGPIDLLVNGAGIANSSEGAIWEQRPEDWWRVFEVNVLGTYLCCREVLRGMVERGRGRIVNIGSGAGYVAVTAADPPGGTSYLASKAALNRLGEALAAQVARYGVSVFTVGPGLVRTAITEELGYPEDAPWTPPMLAAQLVRVLASGRADRLSGRYIHAEHDDIEELIVHTDAVIADDLHAIRLRR